MTRISTKTQSPAPADWKPAAWDIMKTQDEPFFELGKNTHGRLHILIQSESEEQRRI